VSFVDNASWTFFSSDTISPELTGAARRLALWPKEINMTLDQVVIWIVIGGIFGLVAEFFVRGIHVGLVGTVIVGILGALLGGWLFQQFGLHVGTGIVNELVAGVVGAVILLLLMRGLRRL
jgi:uncharacterized membrane protein YeaQ/YmgE (transglycosylase-associated protein family)